MSNKYTPLIILILLCLGFLFRVSLASVNHRSDADGFVINARLFLEGKNIYLYQPYYNYSPLFFYILGFLGKIGQFIPAIPTKVIIHWFLSFIDIFTAFILIRLAGQRKIIIWKTVALFILNPVSIIISGYHGQFDNLAIFFLLLAILLSETTKKSRRFMQNFLIWLILTVGLTVKHTILFPAFSFLVHFSRKTYLAVFLFTASLLVFLASFLPYYFSASAQISQNVFKYKSMEGLYGVSFILSKYCPHCLGTDTNYLIRNIFLLSGLTLAVFLRHRDAARSCLISFLFFLTFTTGIGGQYFVFPIALGALFPSIWFYLYSIVVTLFLLGNDWEFNISVFKIFSWNVVWVVTFMWFLSEIRLIHKFRISQNNLKDGANSTKKEI